MAYVAMAYIVMAYVVMASIWTRNVGQRMEEYCQDVLAQQLFNKSQADHAKDADQSGAQKALAEKEHIKQIATEPPGWTPGWYGHRADASASAITI